MSDPANNIQKSQQSKKAVDHPVPAHAPQHRPETISRTLKSARNYVEHNHPLPYNAYMALTKGFGSQSPPSYTFSHKQPLVMRTMILLVNKLCLALC